MMSLEKGRLCPELMAASRFMLMYPRPLPKLRMAMTQLVGKWTDENQGRLMMQVFQHNKRICESKWNMPAFAITEPPKELQNQTTIPPPPFWKMLMMRDYCLTGDYDVLWFVDADVIFTDDSIPVEALWHFYKYYYPTMDIFFGVDINAINTGIFMLNCTSPTALEFLEEWHKGAPRLSKYFARYYEQTFIHYVLERGSLWVNFVPTTKVFRDDPMPKWNNHSPKALQYPDVWSTRALNERLLASREQCVFSGYPVIDNRARNKGYRTYQPGDVAIHMAGVNAKAKASYLQEYLEEFQHLAAGNVTSFASARDVALSYLQSHV